MASTYKYDQDQSAASYQSKKSMNQEEEMARNGVPESVRTARDEALEVARKAYDMADGARRDAVKRLFEVADNLREQARDVTGEARDNINEIARSLERTANDLNSRTMERVDQAVETVEDNMWKTILGIFIVGLIAGWWLSRD